MELVLLRGPDNFSEADLKIARKFELPVSVALLASFERKRLEDSRRHPYYARYGKERDGSLERAEEQATH